MAKVVVEFDTNTKMMTATIDGNEVADVVEACFYGRYDMMEADDKKFGFSIVQMQKDVSNDMATWIRIVAAQSATRQGAPPHISCVIDRQTKGGR